MRRRMMMGGAAFMDATGGDSVYVIDAGGVYYRVHEFTTVGEDELIVTRGNIATQIDALIIGPGGPGRGSGGGAGGFRTHSRESLDAGTYPIVVGAGGAATYDGFKWTITTPISSALGVESACGGAGAQMGVSVSFAGVAGASGGGGWRNGVGGAGNTPGVSPAQGYAGGGATTTNRSAGGGGAGGTPAISGVNGSPGGAPAYSDITGTNTAYAQGGIGYAEAGVAPAAPTLPGSGGGGQLSSTDSIPGRSGIVIVRYKIARSTYLAEQFDTDATTYIAAVETADGQSLEPAVKIAINDFVVGCKSDGIWSAIKASCILAGARTLNGALVPLVGTAPTNFNFVSADYNRKTGLKGNATTKYLNSNRNNNADPQNSKHLACYKTSTGGIRIGSANANGGSWIVDSSTSIFARANSSVSSEVLNAAGENMLIGVNRPSGTVHQIRANGGTMEFTTNSLVPLNSTIDVFKVGTALIDCRLAFYSIGEALDLAKLDTRVTALMTALNEAIA